MTQRKLRVPVAGSYNTRPSTLNTLGVSSGIVGLAVAGLGIVGSGPSATTKDQRMVNCFMDTIADPISGKTRKYAVKRPGFAASSHTPSSGNVGTAIMVWGGQGSGTKIISAFTVSSNSTIYDTTTSLGAITGVARSIEEGQLDNVGAAGTPLLLIASSDSTGWWTTSLAVTTSPTIASADTHNGTAVIDNMTSTTGFLVGQSVTGTGIGAAARVLTVDSSTQVTLTVNSSASATIANFTRSVFGKIIDADYPGNAGYSTAGNFALLGGFAFIMTADGKLFASDRNTVTAWTTSNYETQNTYPDLGAGCVRFKNSIMAFGTQSIEFWQNNSGTSFPFGRIENMTLKVGATSSDAIATISDNVFWAGSTPQGGLSIFQFDGQLQRISTPEIDTIITVYGTTGLSLTTLRVFGKSFVLVNMSTLTMVYTVEDKSWWEMSNNTASLWYKCAGVGVGTSIINYSVSNPGTSGKIFTQNPANYVFQDNGASYTARIQMSKMDLDTTKRKFWNEIALVCDTEVTTSPTTVAYSDDDYETYQTWGTIDLNSVYPKATRLGSSRDRAWVLHNSSNTPMRIEALELLVEVGNT